MLETRQKSTVRLFTGKVNKRFSNYISCKNSEFILLKKFPNFQGNLLNLVLLLGLILNQIQNLSVSPCL